MSVRIVLLSAAALALVACSEPITSPPTAAPSLAKASADPVAADRYIVKLNGGGARSSFVQKVAALGGRVEFQHEATGIAVVSGLTTAGAAALRGASGVGTVDADAMFSIDDPMVRSLLPESDELAATPASATHPELAARFNRQWNMVQIGAPAAWAGGYLGSSSTKVAILDSGIDGKHQDLVGRVDLGHSVSMLGTFMYPKLTAAGDTVKDASGNPVFVPFTEDDTVAKYFPTAHVTTDLFYHGTHVAATVSSNGLRAAGVTSQTTLMAVKVCAYLNTCPFSSVINGLLYAVDNGADVINMSLGGGFSKAGNGRFVGLINSTFNYARSQGVTIVVSAGNAGSDLQHNGNTYSTYCDTPATICVSATGPLTAGPAETGPFPDPDRPAVYTNYGNTIDIAAPGGNYTLNAAGQIATAGWVWAACSTTSAFIACNTGNVLGLLGTSMASPHVTGAAALLVGQLGRNPAAIKARLLQSADQDLSGTTWDFNGNSPVFGKGRLNVARAVGAI